MSSTFVARAIPLVVLAALATLGATPALSVPAKAPVAARAVAPAATASTAPVPASASHPDTATFAGGCFWSMEAQFEGVPGVQSVISGYTGGWKKQPTYEEVCSHTTGHLEAVQVVFDPAVVAYPKLLDRYWHGIDPTQSAGQFCDIGESYGSAIFVHGEAQQKAAAASKTAIERSGILRRPVVTRVLPAVEFWPAEEYHQDFARKNPVRYQRYREGCGRDRRLDELWGKAAVRPIGH